MSGHRANGFAPIIRDDQFPGFWIMSVGSKLGLQHRLQGRLIGPFQFLAELAKFFLRPMIEQPDGFPVQPVCRPIRGQVGPVTPHGSHLLAASRLPDILSVQNFLFREENQTIRRDHP